MPATKSTPHTTTILRYLKVLDRYTQTQRCRAYDGASYRYQLPQRIRVSATRTWTAHGRPRPRPAALANAWRANHICCSHASCKHRAHYIQCQLGKRRRRAITMAVATAAAAATAAEEAHSIRGSAAEPCAVGSHAKMRRRRHCGGDARTRASRRQGVDHREYP